MIQKTFAVTPVWLEPAALCSLVKHSTTEPLRSLVFSGDSKVQERAEITTKLVCF